MSIANLEIEQHQSTLNISAQGPWCGDNIAEIHKQLKGYNVNRQSSQDSSQDSSQGIVHIACDFSQLTTFDAAAMVMILKFLHQFDTTSVSFSITGLSAADQRQFIFYRKNFVSKKPEPPINYNYLARLGKFVVSYYFATLQLMQFVGEMFVNWLNILIHPSLFRFSATIKHIESSGLKAFPIIGLTSFLVGLVIAFQSAEQLSRFGANIFIVEMVTISVFRELSPMIAAIVVAGRSASAYTAEIGSMKITEEIDAMRTMGFEPHQFLVLPRVFALIISMPLIVFFADIVGMFGGMIIAQIELGISFTEFLARLQAEVDMRHFIIGLVKAPFFGLIIATIGTYRGFQVTGSTDSVGYYTTVSVVNAIFWVIASNALISVVLTELGV